MKIISRILWGAVLSLVLFLVVMYFMSQLIFNMWALKATPNPIDISLVMGLSVAIWFCFTLLLSEPSHGPHVKTWWAGMLFGIIDFSGILVSLAIIVLSIIVILFHTVPTEILNTSKVLPIHWWFLIAGFMYLVVVHVFVRSRFVVPEGIILERNRALYFPGAVLHVNPFVRYEEKIDEDCKIISVTGLPMKCKDGVFEPNIAARVRVKFSGKMSCAGCSLDDLWEDIETRFGKEMQSDVISKDLREIITTKKNPRVWNIHKNIHVEWDGGVSYIFPNPA